MITAADKEISGEIITALAAGDLLSACDLADAAWLKDPAPEFAYWRALARARLGDVGRAIEIFTATGLTASLCAEHRALWARLLKDRALERGRVDELMRAAAAYGAIFADNGDAYPGINMATLFQLSGQASRASAVAKLLLAQPRLVDPANYYDAATRAEALMLTGRADEACATLRNAAKLSGADAGSRATTRKQLTRLANALGWSDVQRAGLVAALPAARTLVYGGHRFAHAPAPEGAMVRMIDEALRAESTDFAFGGLARGADILIAERLLASDIALNVVLPCGVEHFEAAEFENEPRWRERFRACLAGARQLTAVSSGALIEDPLQFRFAADVAMGLAQIRAGHVGGQAVQLVVWDGAGGGDASVASDVQNWNSRGGKTALITPPTGLVAEPEIAVPGNAEPRALKAMLFADFLSFSRLPEARLPIFWREVMQRIGLLLDGHGDAVAYRNTWGDAIYAVIENSEIAARIALELHETLSDIDRQALGVDDSAGMRIGVHCGPVYQGRDFVTGQQTFFGTQVSRAARIEPITPPGAVFATEPFAAMLALHGCADIQCEYVGRIDLAKQYGTERMYRLTRIAGAAR